MTKSRVVPLAEILFVMVVWGLSFLSIKVAVQVFAPMSLALSRFVIASVILITILKIREPGTRLDKKDMPRLALSGIVGITVYFFFENNGIKLTTASTASIIIATIPILTLLSDYIFCGNRLTWPKLIGVMLSFWGVYLTVSGSGQFSFRSEYFVGNLHMLGAAVAWVVYSLVTRPLGVRYSKLAITTYQTLYGTLAIFPFTLFERNNWNMVDGTVILNIFFLGIFGSALGYYIYVNAMEELGVSISSLFLNLIPVVTVIGSYFFLGEKITPAQMLGGGVIILAVYLAELNLKGIFGNVLQNLRFHRVVPAKLRGQHAGENKSGANSLPESK